jgi:hypothetical protein
MRCLPITISGTLVYSLLLSLEYRSQCPLLYGGDSDAQSWEQYFEHSSGVEERRLYEFMPPKSSVLTSYSSGDIMP